MIRIEHGDCLDVLATLAADSLDACVTDPPYHLTNNTGTRSPYPGQYTPIGRPKEPKGGFMGKQWDGGSIAFNPETWRAVFRVLKPGAHLLAMGSTRTYHRLVCAIEDAGFEVRDSIAYLYGTGFPKNLNVSAALRRSLPADVLCVCEPDYQQIVRGFQGDYQSCRGSDDGQSHAAQDTGPASAPLPAGVRARSHGGLLVDDPASGLTNTFPDVASGHRTNERSSTRWTASRNYQSADSEQSDTPSSMSNEASREPYKTEPDRSGKSRSGGGLAGSSALSDANLPRCGRCGKLIVRDGIGTALKPAMELVCLARKPLRGTVAANVLAHGTGAINVDACRISAEDKTPAPVGHYVGSTIGPAGHNGARDGRADNLGRWPANVVHDGSPEVEAAFAAFGSSATPNGRPNCAGNGYSKDADVYGEYGDAPYSVGYLDTGTASRFFYSAKATARDRADSKHPTVKPIALMAWLVRMVTPPGGVILDPFAGSGTTGEAAREGGFDALLIEREAAYIADIRRRMGRVSGDDLPLFAEVIPA